MFIFIIQSECYVFHTNLTNYYYWYLVLQDLLNDYIFIFLIQSECYVFHINLTISYYWYLVLQDLLNDFTCSFFSSSPNATFFISTSQFSLFCYFEGCFHSFLLSFLSFYDKNGVHLLAERELLSMILALLLTIRMITFSFFSSIPVVSHVISTSFTLSRRRRLLPFLKSHHLLFLTHQRLILILIARF